MTDKIDVEKFGNFEKENGLFLREYNGVPYWQMLRFELCRHLYGNAVEYDRKRYRGNYDGKIRKQLKFLFVGIKSKIKNGFIRPADYIFFKDAVRQLRFYEPWENDLSKTVFNMSYEDIEKTYNIGTELFEEWFIYHIKKFFHLIKRDENEYKFLAGLEKQVHELYGKSLSVDEMETAIQKYIVEQKIFGKFWKKIFDKVKPKAFVVVCYYTTQRYAGYREAKNRNIPIIELQHCAINNQQQYWFEDVSGTNNVMPDYLLTYGELWENYVKLPTDERVVPVGFPYQHIEIESVKDVSTDDKTIIVYLVADKEFEKLVISFSHIAVKRGYKVLVKPHPMELGYEDLYYPELCKCGEVEFIKSNDKSIYFWLKYGKHHVMANTTVCLEAIAFDHANLCIAMRFPHEQCDLVLETDMARGFYDADELIKLIEKPMTGDRSVMKEKLWANMGVSSIPYFLENSI